MAGTEVVVERRGEELTALRVEGPMRPGWCGNLANGLAGLGIDIVRGRAVAVGAGSWHGSFELRCPDAGAPAPDVLRAMLETDARAGFTTPIALLDHRLRESVRHGGSLDLRVEGPDRTGFLAALLRRLAYFQLFPTELELQTVGARVHDRLWLRAAGEGTPSARTREALAYSLKALRVAPAGLDAPATAPRRRDV